MTVFWAGVELAYSADWPDGSAGAPVDTFSSRSALALTVCVDAVALSLAPVVPWLVGVKPLSAACGARVTPMFGLVFANEGSNEYRTLKFRLLVGANGVEEVQVTRVAVAVHPLASALNATLAGRASVAVNAVLSEGPPLVTLIW